MSSTAPPAHASTPGTAEQRTHHRVTFSVILIAVMSYAMLQSLVLPVLPTLQASLHTSQQTVTWVLTAFLLSASVATPIVGRLGDMVGKKKVLIAVMVTFALGTLLAAIASSIALMIVARVVQGAAGAILPLAFSIIRDEFPADRVATAISTTAALMAVGGGLGIVLAGPIVDLLDYHYLFWIPLVFIVAATIAAYVVVPESRNTTPGRISVLPAVLMTGWLVALLVAFSETGTWGWVSAKTIGLLVLAAVLIVAWFVSEQRAAQPLVDMRMMRLPAVWTTNLVALLFGVGMYSVLAFLPEFLQTDPSNGYGFGASITRSGIFLLPMTATMFFFGLWSGRLTAQLGSKLVLVMGSAATVAPLGIMTFAHDQQWELYLVSALMGAGLGFAFAAMTNIIVESVPAAQTGIASGMNANIRTIGGSIGAAVMASIVTSGAHPNGVPVNAGYTHGFGFLFLGSIVATAAALIIPTAHKRGCDADADVRRAREQGLLIVRNAEAALVPGASLLELE